jgi:hypothetical protein
MLDLQLVPLTTLLAWMARGLNLLLLRSDLGHHLLQVE